MRLPPQDLLAFERLGHFTQRGVLPADRASDLPAVVDHAYAGLRDAAIRQKLRVIVGPEALAKAEAADPERGAAKLLARLPEGSVPFMQAFNVWRTSRSVAELARSPALAGVAAQLLGADDDDRVRLYQDSLFVKRPGDGETHWHSDLAMAPLDTNQFVTAWIPLDPIPHADDGGSGLVFASGSHRDLAVHFWHSDPREPTDVSRRGYGEASGGELSVGDCTWHHGWLLHCAAPNHGRQPRRAIAFSYFLDGARRLSRPRRKPHDEDSESYADWIGDVRPGQPARHRLLPVVWGGDAGGARSGRGRRRR